MRPPKKQQFFLDWDDTLCPSAWLVSKGHVGERKQPPKFSALPDDQRNDLQILSALVVEVLTICCKLGSVTIITNAEDGWVEQSCECFLPGVWDHIVKSKIPIIPNGTLYSHLPQADWKHQSFANTLKSHDRYNWVVIGDSTYEISAAQRIHNQNPGPRKRLKTIKLVASPTIAYLCSELETLSKMLDIVSQQERDMQMFINFE